MLKLIDIRIDGYVYYCVNLKNGEVVKNDIEKSQLFSLTNNFTINTVGVETMDSKKFMVLPTGVNEGFLSLLFKLPASFLTLLGQTTEIKGSLILYSEDNLRFVTNGLVKCLYNPTVHNPSIVFASDLSIKTGYFTTALPNQNATLFAQRFAPALISLFYGLQNMRDNQDELKPSKTTMLNKMLSYNLDLFIYQNDYMNDFKSYLATYVLIITICSHLILSTKELRDLLSREFSIDYGDKFFEEFMLKTGLDKYCSQGMITIAKTI